MSILAPRSIAQSQYVVAFRGKADSYRIGNYGKGAKRDGDANAGRRGAVPIPST